MSRRARLVGYGGAAALVVTGGLCAVLFGGGTGQVLALAFIGVGLVLAVSLGFAEIGFSEDRDRAREVRMAQRRSPAGRSRARRPPKLDRRRGHHRRLP